MSDTAIGAVIVVWIRRIRSAAIPPNNQVLILAIRSLPRDMGGSVTTHRQAVKRGSKDKGMLPSYIKTKTYLSDKPHKSLLQRPALE